MRKKISKLLKKLPRPSLLWLSVNAVTDVRNKLIGLFLAPGQCFYVVSPSSILGEKIELSTPGMNPKFRFKHSIIKDDGMIESRLVTAWLKMNASKLPYWDIQFIDEEPFPADFNDPVARPAALWIKAMSKYFPFLPTDNYLENDGKVIA